MIAVVHVIPSIARSEGGPSEVIRRLRPELQAAGVRVQIVTTRKDALESDNDLLECGDVHHVRAVTRRWTFAPAIIPVMWRQIGYADLVHVHSVHSFPTTAALVIARLRRKPVLLQPHGALNDYHLARWRWAKMTYLRVIDCFGLKSVVAGIYSSEMEGSEALAALPITPAWRLPLGVDDALLQHERKDTSPPQILFLARLAKKKRVDLFIRALGSEAMAVLQWNAVIAGPTDADLPYEPHDLIQAAGLDKRVKLVGQVGARERAELMAASAIYVLPSDDESFGMSVAEAMGGGCAVVTSPRVGVALDASDAQAALVVSQDPADIADAIRRLLESPGDIDATAARARSYAREFLRWPAVARSLIGYYHRAIGQARVATPPDNHE